MTKFESPSFSVGVGDTQAYRDNWERIFGKNKPEEPKKPDELPPPRDAQPAPEPMPMVEIHEPTRKLYNEKGSIKLQKKSKPAKKKKPKKPKSND